MTETTDVGSVLRQARIRRGQSLEVVSQQTRIPKRMLEALESNRFEEFPAVVYLRGFLKSYCDHLDLEFDPLWSRIDPAKPKAEPSPVADGAHAAAPPPPAPPAAHGTRAADRADERAPDAEGPLAPLMPLVMAAGLLVAAGAVWLLSRKPAASDAPLQPLAPAAMAPLHAPKDLSLRVVARRDVWMQLESGGEMRFQGRFPAGFSQQWQAKDGFLLRTKDPSALSLYMDGKELALTDAMKTSSGDYKLARP